MRCVVLVRACLIPAGFAWPSCRGVLPDTTRSGGATVAGSPSHFRPASLQQNCATNRVLSGIGNRVQISSVLRLPASDPEVLPKQSSNATTGRGGLMTRGVRVVHLPSPHAVQKPLWRVEGVGFVNLTPNRTRFSWRQSWILTPPICPCVCRTS